MKTFIYWEVYWEENHFLPELTFKTKITLAVCFYHVTYAFQSESTLYICLNVKELLARNRRDIWSLSDCNGTRTNDHLVRKRILNHLANLVRLATQTFGQFKPFGQLGNFGQFGYSTIWPIQTICPVWPNSWVFVYELWSFGFESRCSHLNLHFHLYYNNRYKWKKQQRRSYHYLHAVL